MVQVAGLAKLGRTCGHCNAAKTFSMESFEITTALYTAGDVAAGADGKSIFLLADVTLG